jgi:hypothetical protein
MKKFKQYLMETKSFSLEDKFHGLLKKQKPLTPDAKEMMDEWMGGFSMEVNDHLRGRNTSNPSMNQFIRDYDKIIEEHGIELEEPLTVYRATPHGKSTKHTGFLSTSLDPRFAVGVASGKEIPEWSERAAEHKILRITIPKGQRVMPVDARHTKGSKLADYSKEYEILLPRGVNLEVHPNPTKVKIGSELRNLHNATIKENQ